MIGCVTCDCVSVLYELNANAKAVVGSRGFALVLGTMSSHEIITLQFGSFANYVGGHYWNIQVKSNNMSQATKEALHTSVTANNSSNSC